MHEAFALLKAGKLGKRPFRLKDLPNYILMELWMIWHHVPDHPQLHQDVVGQILQAERPLAQPAAFQQGKGFVHPLVPCLAKALFVELVALEQVAHGQRDEV